LWARWNGELDQRYTLGIEEELMLLEPDVIALVALIQSLARLELEGESPLAVPGPEVLAENRFRAARDGPHALALARADALDDVPRLAAANGADRQRAVVAGDGRLDRLVAKLADRFLAPARLAASGLAA
jgi:hypothetical protein